ncbi:MAG: MarR family transcriptional regulator [Actinomycetota bacterium]
MVERERTEATRVVDPAVIRASGALLSAETALGRLIDTEAVAPTGLDPTIVDLLLRLDQAPGHQMRAVELSRQVLMSPSHVSRTLDRAEKADLLRRAPDPDDRRASLVTLTPAGRDVIADFAPRLTTIIDRVINQHLSSEEVDTLVDLLGRIERAACEPCVDDD